MSGERLQRRVSLTTTVLACASTLLVSVAGSVAWATQFQTKVAAAVQTANVADVKAKQAETSAQVSAMRDELTELRVTAERVDQKVDQVLMRLSRR